MATRKASAAAVADRSDGSSPLFFQELSASDRLIAVEFLDTVGARRQITAAAVVVFCCFVAVLFGKTAKHIPKLCLSPLARAKTMFF